MENQKKIGGKRKGAGRKPVLSKKNQYSFYIEGSQVMKFGGEDKFKKIVTDFIYSYGAEKDTQVFYENKPTLENISTLVPHKEPIKKIAIKRTPAHWVELRRACEGVDDYAKWLEDLESDTFLTTREKSQIKATV